MGKVIGIDLGTTNSVVSVLETKNPAIILSPEGDRLLPSIIAFTKDGERLVGNPAKSQMITNPFNTISSAKRLMGKRYSEIKPYAHQFSYDIVEGPEDTIKIKINEMVFSPEEISAMVLHRLKDSAENYLKASIDGAIITVPAYFNDSQRQATKDAGEIAGLKVLRIINEPTAASLAFSIDLKKKSRVVVYDFGGGTIDFSILEVDSDIIKVLSTAGDTNLGGNDLDILLSELILDEIKEQYNLDLAGNKLALQRIRDASEAAKKELSGLDACEINLPFIADSDDGPIHYLKYITRAEFESLINDKVDCTLNICDLCLKHANLSPSDIDEVLLVGGSTRIPLVQKKVREFFGKEPNKKVNPDEIVAIGAAIQGSIIVGERKDILLLDVTPLSLGVKTLGGVYSRIIKANTTIPTSRSQVFSTAEDNQEEVEIMVYQGEREIAEENKLLGKFILKGIQPAPRGLPRIEVTFNININGILMVGAVDLSTRNKKEVVISNSGLLSEEEIKEIKNKAKKLKEIDLKKRDLITLKNKVINEKYVLEKFIEHPLINGDKDLRNECIETAGNAQAVIDREDEEEIKVFLGELMTLTKGLDTFLKKTGANPDLIKTKPKKADTQPIEKARDDTRPLKISG
jgi:molecular chaperone DnaK